MKTKTHTQSGFIGSRPLIGSLLCAAIGASLLTGTLLAFLRPTTTAKVSSRTLTFPERMAYQRAIEEVYWRHLIPLATPAGLNTGTGCVKLAPRPAPMMLRCASVGRSRGLRGEAALNALSFFRRVRTFQEQFAFPRSFPAKCCVRAFLVSGFGLIRDTRCLPGVALNAKARSSHFRFNTSLTRRSPRSRGQQAGLQKAQTFSVISGRISCSTSVKGKTN